MVQSEREEGADLTASEVDSLAQELTDSLAVIPTDSVQLSEKELKRKKEQEEREAEELKRNEERAQLLEEIAAERRRKTTAKLLEAEERQEERLKKRRDKVIDKILKRKAKAEERGKTPKIDSTELRELDRLLSISSAAQDSIVKELGAPDLLQDSLSEEEPAMVPTVDSLPKADSIYRLIKAFRDVKIYRSDVQAVCDSLTALSLDSTAHLYINPVLWNKTSQISADIMDIYTKNQELTKADFIGAPMMVSMIDTLHYDQVAGKEMTAFFRQNQIYRNDVNGNAQTIYYMQDGEPLVITSMGVIESGDITFFIENQQVVKIVYRQNPDFDIYPIDEIPADQELKLKGFKWEEERRPTKEQIFDRQVRSTQREAKREVPKPFFPIQKKIDHNKNYLIEQNLWYDRNESVDGATVEWMRGLGYTPGERRKENP